MSDAPERIWIMPARDQWERGTGEWMAEFWGLPTETPYILEDRAALAASPEVQALIREAEARGMERAAQEVEEWAVQSYDGSLTQAASAIRAEAAAIRGEGK